MTSQGFASPAGVDIDGMRNTSVRLHEWERDRARSTVATYVSGDEEQRVLDMLGLEPRPGEV